ncbi:MAG: alpha-mannosidase [Oscillatoriales cyanobacterium]|nr:MAG: alpha-mannosidase [Oscillatoriales cyanobacterium]
MTSQIPDSWQSLIDRLRALTRQNRQPHWRVWTGEQRLDRALDPDRWAGWPQVEINEKGHVAFAAGRSTLWLAQRIVVPECLAEPYPIGGLNLRLALGWWAEFAEIYLNGQFVQAGDLFDPACRRLLSASAQPGQAIDLAVRLVSPGHDRGALVKADLVFETAELVDRLDPGTLADELSVVALFATLESADLPPVAAIAQAINQIAWDALPDRPAFERSLQQARELLISTGWSDWLKQRQIHAVGHAHLDLAWLWPVADTWDAADRTFRAVLQLQDQFPELTFTHSSPALFEWLAQERPALFEQVRDRAAAGRWELAAGLWIEPELNCISGESIARQILYGQRFALNQTGQWVDNQPARIAWLPDTFGFCWQLPQLLRLGGIEIFATQKLRWNDTTPFPHEAIAWESPDGSQVLGWMLPPIGTDADPLPIARYAVDWERSTGETTSLWLPGLGDRGGGPTREMLEQWRRWAASPLFPRLGFGRVADLGDRLVAKSWPRWQNELYLEFHRGCYTTHLDQKLANRRCETLLYEAELWLSLAELAGLIGGDRADQAAQTLDRAWKRVMFNQFHDILPGTSIREVYETTDRDWQTAETEAIAVCDQAWAAWAGSIAWPEPPQPGAIPVAIFNGLNWDRAGVVELAPPPGSWQALDGDGRPLLSQRSGDRGDRLLVQIPDCPGVGYQLIWLWPDAEPTLADCPLFPPEPLMLLENPWLRVAIDPTTGDLLSLVDLSQNQEILSGPSNQLQAFHDAGQYWDAWNLDPAYETKPLPPAELLDCRWHELGPVRQVVRVRRRVGESTIIQDYVLEARSPLLQIQTTAHWQETHVLLKAAFHLAGAPDLATYEIPCGAIVRPTRPQTEAEQAQWEVPALRWADLASRFIADSDRLPTDPLPQALAVRGVSLLTTGPHGFDARPGQLRLSLLRSPCWPDPQSDRGIWSFTYAIYPHMGGWQGAHTPHRAAELQLPLRAMPLSMPNPQPPDQPACPGDRASQPGHGRSTLLQFGSPSLHLMALTRHPQRADRWLLRAYESTGHAGSCQLTSDLGLQGGDRVNLLGQPLELADSTTPTTPTTPTTTTKAIKPWQVVCLELDRPT